MFRSLFRKSVKSSSRRFFSLDNNIFSGIGRLNHIALACPDLKAASDMYKNVLGASVSSPVDLPEHGVTTVFVTLDNTKLELLHPLGNNSPISGFLEKNKSGGLHHICLEVNDINSAVSQLKLHNIRIIGDIKIGAHGLPVIFIHPKDMNGCLIELEEVKQNKV